MSHMRADRRAHACMHTHRFVYAAMHVCACDVFGALEGDPPGGREGEDWAKGAPGNERPYVDPMWTLCGTGGAE